MKRRDFTLEELKPFDGNGPDGRVLIGVLGKVYDVTKGKRFYGPGNFDTKRKQILLLQRVMNILDDFFLIFIWNFDFLCFIKTEGIFWFMPPISTIRFFPSTFMPIISTLSYIWVNK